MNQEWNGMEWNGRGQDQLKSGGMLLSGGNEVRRGMEI
jgi:hypothetical protein